MTAGGASGALRYGYHTAVALGRWTMEPCGLHQFTLRAAVAHVHAVWGHQSPLDLSLSLGATEWFWEAVEHSYDGEEVVVNLATRPRAIQHAAVSSSVGGSR